MYIELIDSLQTVKGSEYRRPVSLSDSFTFSEQNIQRAASFHTIHKPNPIDKPIVIPPNSTLWNTVLKFILHICLISVFETVFFFQYVAKLEDSGILTTIGSFSNSIVYSCMNLTKQEKTYINTYISPHINISDILYNGNSMRNSRMNHNHILFIKSWIYVCVLLSFFVVCTCIAHFRKFQLDVRIIIVENIGFITILGFYEYMFFSTIVLPYSTVSPSEIVENTILQIESQCHIL